MKTPELDPLTLRWIAGSLERGARKLTREATKRDARGEAGSFAHAYKAARLINNHARTFRAQATRLLRSKRAA